MRDTRSKQLCDRLPLRAICAVGVVGWWLVLVALPFFGSIGHATKPLVTALGVN